MPKIDVTRFMEQSGMRKARFGGYEPDDVRAALQALCTEYEQRLGRAEAQAGVSFAFALPMDCAPLVGGGANSACP